MSGPKCVDTRQIRATNLDRIMQAAQQNLGVRATAVEHRKVDVVATTLKGAVNAVRNALQQDKLERRETGGLQARLGAKGGPSLALPKGPQWQALPLEAFVADAQSNGDGVRVVKHFEAEALGGACVVVFEHVDEMGEKTYNVGFEKEGLVDDEGEWLDPGAQAAYEAFFEAANVGTELALEGGDHPITPEMDNAINLALADVGLEPHAEADDGSEVFSTETGPSKTNTAGGKG
jgi:hypothetical protein